MRKLYLWASLNKLLKVANEVNNASSIETPVTPINSEVKVNAQSQSYILENFSNIYWIKL